MNTLKKCLPDIAAVIFFILISVAYFFVPMTRGEVLYQGDNTAGAASTRTSTTTMPRPATCRTGQTPHSAVCRRIRCGRRTRARTSSTSLCRPIICGCRSTSGISSPTSSDSTFSFAPSTSVRCWLRWAPWYGLSRPIS